MNTSHIVVIKDILMDALERAKEETHEAESKLPPDIRFDSPELIELHKLNEKYQLLSETYHEFMSHKW